MKEIRVCFDAVTDISVGYSDLPAPHWCLVDVHAESKARIVCDAFVCASFNVSYR